MVKIFKITEFETAHGKLIQMYNEFQANRLLVPDNARFEVTEFEISGFCRILQYTALLHLIIGLIVMIPNLGIRHLPPYSVYKAGFSNS